MLKLSRNCCFPVTLTQAARKAGWLPDDDKTYPRVSHVGFGLVLGDDNKRFRTRAAEVVRLADLLDEAKDRSKAALIERGMVSNFVSSLSKLLNYSFFSYYLVLFIPVYVVSLFR